VLLRCDGRAIARLAWSLLVLLLLLVLVRQTGELSSWLLTLLLPLLGDLPLWAAWAVLIYVLADQVLLLPISVLGNRSGLEAFRSGRLATDPHWLHALGRLLVVSLVLRAGFLLLVGLAVALPWAMCTLTAAYRQLFVITMASGQPRHPHCTGPDRETGWRGSNGSRHGCDCRSEPESRPRRPAPDGIDPS